MKLGIIGAMKIEVDTLKENMQNKSVTWRTGMEFCEGTLEGLPAVVVQCGVGKVNAALCAQILICQDVQVIVGQICMAYGLLPVDTIGTDPQGQIIAAADPAYPHAAIVLIQQIVIACIQHIAVPLLLVLYYLRGSNYQ